MRPTKETLSERLLREQIRQLEVRRENEEAALKAQLLQTWNSMKPLALLKSSVKDLSDSRDLQSSLVQTASSMLVSFLARRYFYRSANPLKKIMGTLFQYGANRSLADHAGLIRDLITVAVNKVAEAMKR
ncbi:MAG: hypothetical protein LBR06_10430 [Bacteroidales bacterium]|jgi:hypothetical protein|nr:hypothetical protein [Bacteroidales bacterium]